MLGNNVFGASELNYFDYIIAAELALCLPLYFIEAPMRNLKDQIDTKLLNTFLMLGWSELKILLVNAYNDIFRVIWRIVLSIVILKMFFLTNLNIDNLKSALILLVINLPFSIFIGLLLISIYLFLGRGQFLVGQINVFLSVLSGAFFPTTVFPKVVSDFVVKYIPYTRFLMDIRNANTDNFSIASFLFWLAFVIVGFYLFKLGLRKYVIRGLSIFRF